MRLGKADWLRGQREWSRSCDLWRKTNRGKKCCKNTKRRGRREKEKRKGGSQNSCTYKAARRASTWGKKRLKT